MDDEELRRRFDAMLARIDDSQEAVLIELRAIRAGLHDPRGAHDATRILDAIERSMRRS